MYSKEKISTKNLKQKKVLPSNLTSKRMKSTRRKRRKMTLIPEITDLEWAKMFSNTTGW